MEIICVLRSLIYILRGYWELEHTIFLFRSTINSGIFKILVPYVNSFSCFFIDFYVLYYTFDTILTTIKIIPLVIKIYTSLRFYLRYISKPINI